MKALKICAKIVLAGMIAVTVLSLLICFYYLTPIRTANPKGNTDYTWGANSVWVRATEGISAGKCDENGFNNKKAVSDPDFIVVGSSHAEAMNVMQDENFTSRLGEMYDGKYTFYNMGVSGHELCKVCSYLKRSINAFEKTPMAVIIETSTVSLTEENAAEAVGEIDYSTNNHDTGLIALLQKVPFFRLLYRQKENGLINLFSGSGSDADTANGNVTEDVTVNEKAYDDFFTYLASVKDEYGIEIIIFYHQPGTLEGDGTLSFEHTKEHDAFSRYAEEKGIVFVDMTDDFDRMYREEHRVAHGFATGKLAEGHLNAYGHEAIAKRLSAVIDEMEAEGKLCK